MPRNTPQILSFYGIIDGLVSAALFGLMSYSVFRLKGVSSSSQLAFIRAVVSLILLTPLIWNELPKIYGRHWRSLWLRAFAGSISILCYYWTLQHGNVGTARLYSDMSPIFVLLIAVFFYKERLGIKEVLGILIVVITVAIINLIQPKSTPHQAFTVLIVGITGSLCMAVSMTALKQATKYYSSNLIVWALSLAVAVVSIANASSDWTIPKLINYPWIAVTALTGLIAQVYRTKSFKYLKAPVAAALCLSVLFFNLFFVVLFDHIYPTTLELCCYSLAAIGLFITTKNRGPT